MTEVINSKSYWNRRFATDWDEKEGRQQTTFFYEIAVNFMPTWLKSEIISQQLSICDAGCAEGDGTDVLANTFPASLVVGVDFAEEAIQKAKKFYPERNFICSSVEHLNQNFDIILSSNTLEHFTNPFAVVKELLHKTNRYLVLLLPFQEFDRIDEHFFTFNYDVFPLRINDFQLAYFKEIDGNSFTPTYWPGKQVMVVYANSKIVDLSKITVDSIVSNIPEYEETINSQKEKADFLSRSLEESNQRLNQKDIQMGQLLEQLTEKEKQISKLIDEVSLKDHLAFLERQLEHQNLQIDAINGQLTSRDHQIDLLHKQLATKDHQIDVMNNTIEQKNTELQAKENVIAELNGKITENGQLIAELTNKLQMKNEETQALYTELVNKDHELSTASEQKQMIENIKESYISDLQKEISNREKEIKELSAQLNHIYMSDFWKVANMYYKIRDRVFPFNVTYRTLKKLRQKNIGGKIKKVISVWKNQGTKVLVKKIQLKLAERKKTEAVARLNEPNQGLNWYEYKFFRYKRQRNEIYPLELSKISIPCVKDLVSIVLPVYNGEDMVGDAIESVLKQTYPNFELIIINDGSKDRTGEIIEYYSTLDKRIRVYHQENRKIPRTLSRGFNLAKGEFFTWTSADNIMHPDYIEKLVQELKKDANTAMVFANMRLIDKEGNVIKNHGWYEDPQTSIVKLPTKTYELNIYPNNTIGAAFMYRATAARVLGEYSKYKHTLEDYDYWMRMNSLFNIKHASFQEAIYDYRFHDKSLTAQDKELGITANRYKLMVLDDFRRDFYMSPIIWLIEGTSPILSELKQLILNKGHILFDVDKLSLLPSINLGTLLVFVSDNEQISESIKSNEYIYKVKLVHSQSASDFSDYQLCVGLHFKKNLPDGCFRASDVPTLFSLIDSKAKNDHLYKIEGEIEEGVQDHRYKISVIICTYQRTQKLINALQAVLNQTISPFDYEIIVVNNDIDNVEILKLVEDLRVSYPDHNIQYQIAPIKGLSFARNIGMFEARGEVLLYLDDDSIADSDLLEQTIICFDQHPEAGVIGGNIILNLPDPRPELVLPGTEALWSQLIIDSEEYKESKYQWEFPYGANFAVRKKALMQIGGFRTSYGRKGNDFAGGEEMVVSFMMRDIGYTVGLNPKSRVLHDVDIRRYTLEHVEKTMAASLFTNYQMQADLYAPMESDIHYDQSRIELLKEEIKSMRETSDSTKVNYEILYKEYLLKAYERLIEFKKQDLQTRMIN